MTESFEVNRHVEMHPPVGMCSRFLFGGKRVSEIFVEGILRRIFLGHTRLVKISMFVERLELSERGLLVLVCGVGEGELDG